MARSRRERRLGRAARGGGRGRAAVRRARPVRRRHGPSRSQSPACAARTGLHRPAAGRTRSTAAVFSERPDAPWLAVAPGAERDLRRAREAPGVPAAPFGGTCRRQSLNVAAASPSAGRAAACTARDDARPVRPCCATERLAGQMPPGDRIRGGTGQRRGPYARAGRWGDPEPEDQRSAARYLLYTLAARPSGRVLECGSRRGGRQAARPVPHPGHAAKVVRPTRLTCDPAAAGRLGLGRSGAFRCRPRPRPACRLPLPDL